MDFKNKEDRARLLADTRFRVFVAVLVVIMAAASFYFYYWVRRPEYSFAQAQKALVSRNADMFEKYVDLDSVYTNIIDDILAAMDAGIASGREVDEFTRTMAAGLSKNRKDTIVTVLKNTTLSAVKNEEGVRDTDLSPFGMLGKSVETFCRDAHGNEPGVIFAGVTFPEKGESFSKARVLFYDSVKHKKFALDFRMERKSDGQWKIIKVSNLREAFRTAEDVLSNSLEIARKKEEERIAKVLADREKEEKTLEILPVAEREKASAKVRVALVKYGKKMRSGENIMYRFSSVLRSHDTKDATLSVYNDVIINKENNKLRNITSLVLYGKKDNIGSFDSIYFFSPKKGVLLDTATWEKKNVGAKLSINTDENGFLSTAFTATTDDFVDIYKLITNDGMQIAFLSNNKIIASFEADDRMRASISRFMDIKETIRSKLLAGDGSYTLLPVSNELLREADEEYEKQNAKKAETGKKEKAVLGAPGKAGDTQATGNKDSGGN